MEPYIHHVQYYETDQMGISHHSNYIRWMEEARTDYLEKKGLGYKQIEESGVIIPVLAVNGRYKETTTFDDRVQIHVRLTELRGLKFSLEYVMTNLANGHVVFEGTSEHCFLGQDKKPLRIQKEKPEIYQKFREMAE